MIINHNISAINSYRNQQQNSQVTGNSISKLSSGMRINQAADDSAGLAISEKMRAQIRGLDKAKQNITDGISLIQVAEGAMAVVVGTRSSNNSSLIQNCLRLVLGPGTFDKLS